MSDPVVAAKKDAGIRAANMVKDGMIVGLGTGSTVFFAMERLGERIKTEGLRIYGVPTSNQTAMRAEEYGIPLTTLTLHPKLDIAIDGADQVDPKKQLIKGRPPHHIHNPHVVSRPLLLKPVRALRLQLMGQIPASNHGNPPSKQLCRILDVLPQPVML